MIGMMTLFKVTVRPPPDVAAAPRVVEMIRPGPAIHHPAVGASFAVVDDEGRTHRGVIVEIEDLGIRRGGAAPGEKEHDGEHAAIGELRTVRLTIEPRAAWAQYGRVH